MLRKENFIYRELNNGEVHVFYRVTRIFLMKRRWIRGGPYWTCKSCLSYVPSFKEEDFGIAQEKIAQMLQEFLALFSEGDPINDNPRLLFGFGTYAGGE